MSVERATLVVGDVHGIDLMIGIPPAHTEIEPVLYSPDSALFLYAQRLEAFDIVLSKKRNPAEAGSLSVNLVRTKSLRVQRLELVGRQPPIGRARLGPLRGPRSRLLHEKHGV